MSHLNRGLTNIDVHVGDPSPDYQHWAKVTVHFHGFDKKNLLREQIKVQTSPRFSCLGFEWDLSLKRIQRNLSPDQLPVQSSLSLRMLSTMSGKITHAFKVQNVATLLSAVSGTTFRQSRFVKCDLPTTKKFWESINDGVLVIEVLMRPSSYSFHTCVPVNPSACKTIRELFNVQECSDIQFEVDEGKTNKSTKIYYAHRLILKRAAPLLAELITPSDFSNSIINIHDVSPDVFEVFLRYIYGWDSSFLEFDSTHTMKILDVANKYGVTGLKLQAEAHMVSKTMFDSKNVMEILNFADTKNCALLKEAAMLYVAENPSEVVKNGSMDHFPDGLMKDILVAMAGRETKKQAVRELSTMSVGELRHKAHAKGIDMDGSREMLISALTQHDKSDDDKGIGS